MRPFALVAPLASLIICLAPCQANDFQFEVKSSLPGYKIIRHKEGVVENADNGSSLDIYQRVWKRRATEWVMDLQVGKSHEWEIERFFYSSGRLERYYHMIRPFRYDAKGAHLIRVWHR